MAGAGTSGFIGFGARGKRRPGAKGRYTFLLYVTISVTLLASEVLLPILPNTLRALATDAVTPVLSVLRVPISALQGALERIGGVSDLYLESERLRSENNRLKQYRETVLVLSRENEKLREMLSVPGRENLVVATGRVVGVGGGSFEESIILDVGASDNVGRDMPAVTVGGLVGRTITVGQWSSRVLMLTDLNSRVPVRVERTGALAIASGSNAPYLSLKFLSEDTRVRLGDRLLTSGHGGLFPPDIPVAVVADIEGDAVKMAPFVLLDRLDYISLLNYSRPSPAESETVSGTKSLTDRPSATDGSDS